MDNYLGDAVRLHEILKSYGIQTPLDKVQSFIEIYSTMIQDMPISEIVDLYKTYRMETR